MTTVDRTTRTAQEARPSGRSTEGAATREGAQRRASDPLRTHRPDRWGVTAAPHVRPRVTRYQARPRRSWLGELVETLVLGAALAIAVWLFLIALFLVAP